MERDARGAETAARDAANAEADLPFCAKRVERLAAEAADAETALERLLEGVKGEVEAYHQQLGEVGLNVCGRMCVGSVRMPLTMLPSPLHSSTLPQRRWSAVAGRGPCCGR
eukprot:339237-Chlamydomonas_euryale.AAC.1